MRGFIVMIFMGLGFLLQFGGGIALVGLFVYGVYAIFAKSLALGLMLIGAAVVGGWVVKIASGLLMAVGVGAASIGVKDD